ncbi:unnamed protein product [Victoria cruziana]
MMVGGGLFGGLFSFLVPLWASAVLLGLLVGWAWKPKWANMVVASGGGQSLGEAIEKHLGMGFNSLPSLDSFKALSQSCISWVSEERSEKGGGEAVACSSTFMERDQSVVNIDDFQHLRRLVEVTDGGPVWHPMMERTTPTMSYQAWRRDPETGPPQYRSRTVYEDAAPELVRDFFWDDEFRSKWDDMLLHAAILEEHQNTGTMIVHWIRKFPFFCSDREYTIGRRIWKSGDSYYCVTKGVAYPYLPRHNKPRRVDLYYSSWCIRAVESRRGDGQLTSCEVLLFHHEDMGIPWEIAKIGVRQGMWGCVKKIEPGLRAYQSAKQAGEPLSRSAEMAQINTRVGEVYLRSMELIPSQSEIAIAKKPWRENIPKFLIVGGAVALACSLDRGLLTKAVIFGVARRLAKIGRTVNQRSTP